jgi:hypothetical protein
MSCEKNDPANHIKTANTWVSAINFVAERINPFANIITSQFAIATQAGATGVALANGDGTAL